MYMREYMTSLTRTVKLYACREWRLDVKKGTGDRDPILILEEAAPGLEETEDSDDNSAPAVNKPFG